MKRISLGLVCVLCLAFLLVSYVPAGAYSSDDPLVLKVGIENPPMDMKSRTIKKLGDLVEERSKGRIKFKYFYGGSLIKKPQFVDGVARGIADISTGPISFVTGKIPELSIFEIYGAYKLDEFAEMQAAVEKPLSELLATKGIHHVLIQYSGSVVFCHKDKFLKSPEDWKGQKIRLGGRWQSTLGKKWGASPVFMPPPDLYLALQRGVIDGYMLIYDIVFGLKLYEVSPYITDSGFSNNIEIVTMGLKKWNQLTDEDKAIFNQAVEEVKPWTIAETRKYYDQLQQKIIEKGGKIHKMTPEEKSAYLKDAYGLWPEVKEVGGPVGEKFMEILKNFRDQ